MSENPTQPPEFTTLAAYLAANDLPCHACGYNLRGVQVPYCPECGAVIPRPRAADLAGGPAHRLWCRGCGTDLSACRDDRCPQCGASTLIAPEADQRLRALGWMQRATGGLALLMLLLATTVMLLATQSQRLTVKRPGFVLVGCVLLLAAALNGALVRRPDPARPVPDTDTRAQRELVLRVVARIAVGALLLAGGALLVAYGL